MCLYPRIIRNRKYTATKKNGGIVPAPPIIKDENGNEWYDERVMWVAVGCQKCMECKKQKARGWQVRLMEEVRNDCTGIFVTLTFSNESIYKLNKDIEKLGNKDLTGYNRDNAIAKIGVRKFLERWRKKYGKSVKHWLVTELGHEGTENIHMHGIIWTDKSGEEIKERWGYGFGWMGDEHNGYVNEQTINYIIKYTNKIDKDHEEYNPIVLTSAGIGKSYLDREDAKKNRYNKKGTKEVYTTQQGFKIALPTYYRNHIYSEEEKEKLWTEKLDKQERWVDGVKIKNDKDDEEYYKALYTARAKNKRLGYGSDEINWEKREYENERRNMNFKKRIEDEENKNYCPF